MDNTYIQVLKKTPFEKRKNINITVGLSGGVDSAVTAYLLKEAGFNVKCVYMLCFDDGSPNCRSNADKSDAIKVASHLNIPIEIWDYQKEYKQKVIDYFVSAYKKGITPNPDILCNSEIKFKLFLEEAISKGSNYVATGHYAKLVKNIPINPAYAGRQYTNKPNLENSIYDSEHINLVIPKDKSKDQTYFLSDVAPAKFSNMLFPLGDYLKSQVREIAKLNHIPVFDKKDSTGICFLEGIKMQDFLRKNIKEKVGNVVNSSGEIIGKHYGVWFYTLGQRHGFKVDKYNGKPLYVISKHLKDNELIVGEKKDIFTKTLTLNNLSVPRYTDTPVKKPGDLYLRIRNLGNLIKIEKILSIDGISVIKLSKKIDAVAPGQYSVIYQKISNNYIAISAAEII